MRDRGIVLDPYLDHGVLARVCQEVGVPVEELDPSGTGPAQVKRSRDRSLRSCPLVGNLVGPSVVLGLHWHYNNLVDFILKR